MTDFGFLKHVVLQELVNSGSDDVEIFTEWVKSGQLERDLHSFKKQRKPISKLKKIAKDLKAFLPLDGILSSENILGSSIGPNSDCNSGHTVHLDEFLYDESDLEELQAAGVIRSKHYCSNCNSFDIKETILISHSLDATKLAYICTVLLPPDTKNLTLLDVGSRIGAVIYGAYYWTNCNNIVGIEINSDLCVIQNKMLAKHRMEDRVKVINSDILLAGDQLSQSDILILNNVFEFFMGVTSQTAAWKFLKDHLKPGCYVITVPSVEESLDALGIYKDFCNWLEKILPYQPANMINFDMSDTQFGEIYFYKVK